MAALGDDGLAADGDGGVADRDHDRSESREPWRGVLLVDLSAESLDDLVGDLHADDLERLDLRLAFEAWADSRE